MRAGWWKFQQNSASELGTAPDSAVAPPRVWLIRAALLASTLALLGTSADPATPPEGTPTGPVANYEFVRTVEGDGVDLTSDQPTASFLVTLRATELGPEGVVSTNKALATITATLTSSETEGVTGVTMRVGRDESQHFTESVSLSQPLLFEGTCEQPAENAPCQAAFSVDFARSDDGAQGGTLHIDWSFLLASSGMVVSTDATLHTDQDPPWTVEITPQ